MQHKFVYKLSRKFKTPEQVQKFLFSMHYNHEQNGPTCRSALGALKKNQCHCLEATFIAAAILEHHGYPPTILSLESQDNLDHVLFLFKHKSKWGTVGRSRDVGLNGRAPVYKTIKELVWSYFDAYIDNTGKITAYQVTNLDYSKSNWRESTRNVWKAENFLIKLKHRKLKSSLTHYKSVYENYLKNGSMKKQKNWW